MDEVKEGGAGLPQREGRYTELPATVPVSTAVVEVPVDEQPFGGPEGGGADGD